jgi:hypothetical protein
MTAGPDIGRPAPMAWSKARGLLVPLLAALAGLLLITLLSQIPARHLVDVGGYDAAYVQGFYDVERADDPGDPAEYLTGSDGTARWTRPTGSVLLFPQAGLPGAVSLRLRAWQPDQPPPRVTVLLNGDTLLTEFQADGGWQQFEVPVRTGLFKASDFFIEIRTAPSLILPDGREVGVLLDRADYRLDGPFVTPYPAQLLYGALIGAMLGLLLRRTTKDEGRMPGTGSVKRRGIGRWSLRLRGFHASTSSATARRGAGQALGVGLTSYGLLWLLLYHNQPPLYPYPLRGLPPAICLGLAGLLVLRYGPQIAARVPYLIGVVAPITVIGFWLVATLIAAQGHVTLARPGVENDFRVFATRETLAQVFRADGFYNLGYPLLLWLVRPLFGDNAFLAGRLLAALSGAAMLAGGYWLARSLLPSGSALLALVVLALSGLVAQYGLYVGSDMPFAACAVCCVAALISGIRRPGGFCLLLGYAVAWLSLCVILALFCCPGEFWYSCFSGGDRLVVGRWCLATGRCSLQRVS